LRRFIHRIDDPHKTEQDCKNTESLSWFHNYSSLFWLLGRFLCLIL
jgi:hypothetical protein